MICPACLNPTFSTPATASMDILRGFPPKLAENVELTFTGRSRPVKLEGEKEKNDRFKFVKKLTQKLNLLVKLLAHMANHFADSVFLQLRVFTLQVHN